MRIQKTVYHYHCDWCQIATLPSESSALPPRWVRVTFEVSPDEQRQRLNRPDAAYRERLDFHFCSPLHRTLWEADPRPPYRWLKEREAYEVEDHAGQIYQEPGGQ